MRLLSHRCHYHVAIVTIIPEGPHIDHLTTRIITTTVVTTTMAIAVPFSEDNSSSDVDDDDSDSSEDRLSSPTISTSSMPLSDNENQKVSKLCPFATLTYQPESF